MSAGLGLLKKLISDKRGIQTLTESGIARKYFRSEELEIYDAITNHQRLFKSVPSQRTVEVETGIRFGNLPDEPLGYWIEQVIKRYESQLIVNAVEKIKDQAVGGRLSVAKDSLRELTFGLSGYGGRDKIHVLGKEAEQVMKAHNTRRAASGLSGVPLGFPFLDRVLDGAQSGDVVVLVGRPGVGKSYLMLRFCLHTYLESEAVPLFVPMEMTPFQCARRLLALKAKVSATQLRLGRLDSLTEEAAFVHVNELLGSEKPFYMIGASLKTTVEDLALRVQELRPSALFVDGGYLLRTRKQFRAKWERISETAEVLKSIGYEFGIPVIASYQFSKKGLGLDNIGGSDDVAKLGSIVMGLRPERQADFFTGKDYKILQLLKGREGESGSIRILFNMLNTTIDQDSVVDGDALISEDSE